MQSKHYEPCRPRILLAVTAIAIAATALAALVLLPATFEDADAGAGPSTAQLASARVGDANPSGSAPQVFRVSSAAHRAQPQSRSTSK
jgi:hypothetical protein